MRSRDLIITKEEFIKAYESILIAREDPRTLNGILVPYFSSLEHYIEVSMMNMAEGSHGDIVLREPGKDDVIVKANPNLI